MLSDDECDNEGHDSRQNHGPGEDNDEYNDKDKGKGNDEHGHNRASEKDAKAKERVWRDNGYVSRKKP